MRWTFGEQPQQLFDRLPEHSDVQLLSIASEPSDFRFLFRLNHLIDLGCSIDAETIWKVFEELQFLSEFRFKQQIGLYSNHSKRFEVRLDSGIEIQSLNG